MKNGEQSDCDESGAGKGRGGEGVEGHEGVEEQEGFKDVKGIEEGIVAMDRRREHSIWVRGRGTAAEAGERRGVQDYLHGTLQEARRNHQGHEGE